MYRISFIYKDHPQKADTGPAGWKATAFVPLHATVIFDMLGFQGAIPPIPIKVRVASFIGDNEIKTQTLCGFYRLPAEKLPIGSDQDMLSTARKMRLNLHDKVGGLFAADRFTFTKLSQKVFPRQLDETKHRSVPFLASALGIVPLTTSLRFPVKRLDRCIDVD